MDTMFEIPDNETVEKCIVTLDSVNKNDKPKLVYRNGTKETA